MIRDNSDWTELLLAIVGITARGFLRGLYAFLWRLWAAVSFLWVFLLVLVFLVYAEEGENAGVYIWLALVPPALLLLIEGMLAWVIAGRSFAPSSRTFPRTETDEGEEEQITQDARPRMQI